MNIIRQDTEEHFAQIAALRSQLEADRLNPESVIEREYNRITSDLGGFAIGAAQNFYAYLIMSVPGHEQIDERFALGLNCKPTGENPTLVPEKIWAFNEDVAGEAVSLYRWSTLVDDTGKPFDVHYEGVRGMLLPKVYRSPEEPDINSAKWNSWR